MASGRKRKPGRREPNGRMQRVPSSERADQVIAPVIEARQRVFGLSEGEAKAMPESTVLGCLRATGKITARQYAAGSSYRDVVREYDRYMLAKGLPQPGDLNRSHGHDGELSEAAERRYRERYRAALANYQACAAALVEANGEDRLASATVKAVVLADFPVPAFTPALRVGLDHLARALRIGGEVEPGSGGPPAFGTSQPEKVR